MPSVIIQQWEAMQTNLALCTTMNERINCEALCKREIRETAERERQSRKLTKRERELANRCAVGEPF